MEGSSARPGSSEWDEEWVMCSCNLCKWQKRRRRRISMQHISEHGEFDRTLLDNALRQDSVLYLRHIHICVHTHVYDY